MTSLLLIEDDRHFADGLRYNLERADYDVDIARTGDRGLELAITGTHQLIILDLMLPNMHGFDVLAGIREAGLETPVIILSARDGEVDKIRGFDLGANDYVSKPFGIGEFLARVRARLPDLGPTRDAFALCGGMVRLQGLVFERDGERTPLTPTEAELLQALHEGGGDPVSRERLLQQVWGVASVRTRTLDTHITRLRKKLERDPAEPKHIQTVHGVGYRLQL